LGASGYAGRELCALIAAHPNLDLAFATASEQRGDHLLLPDGSSITFCASDDAPLSRADLVFSALPHGCSRIGVEAARSSGAKVVDLSSDFRPGHGTTPVVPYGLTEATRDAVRGAPLVANPGCYPTAILLALWPLVAKGLVVPGATIHVSAASGVSGAGNSPRRELLFGEVAENFRAYSTGNSHRHVAEMRDTLRAFGADADLVFTPHLLPVSRGILATIAVQVTQIDNDPLKPWRDHYAGERFIELADGPPSLKDVVNRNVVRIHAQRVEHVRAPTLLVFSAIDNLMKGAAGQAVQNANLMLGLAEATGLPA
jgi:N-acetyl-gamma-glutamyl-phosphate reductase